MESCDTSLDEPEVQIATFQEAVPPSGTEIEVDTPILIRFDASPRNLVTNGEALSISGRQATINGPFPPGSLTIILTWDDGEIALNYLVKPPKIGNEITTETGEMVFIPGGEFAMGTHDEDPNAWVEEGPIHIVYVDAFYMDTHEVTNASFQTFILANPEWQKERIPDALHQGSYLAEWNGNNFPILKAKHPVTNVTWHAAMAYAQWAGKRLPTEAEWERGARGGLIDQKYPWGNTITKTDANHDYRIGDTTDVGRYPANAYGLHDMAGNVWEWCLDAYEVDFYANSPRKNPLAGVSDNILSNLHELTTDFTKEIETLRIIRGGSCYSRAEDVRVTSRTAREPNESLRSIGFRCVKDVNP